MDHAAISTYGAAETPLEIAALSRLLSANVWQKRDALGAGASQDWALGSAEERNVVLRISR